MVPGMSRGRRGLLIGVVALGLAGHARAGNTVHPRTPVLWPDAPCIQAVDRSQTALFEFGYAIPAEDTNLTIDELDDSRTHQFVAFCRQWPAGSPPPNYISVADLQRAINSDVELDASKLDDPEATLETSAAWAGCWTRVTADDQRRPITFAAASEPVVWDASAVDPGTWMIAGYTWEPPYNLWRRAPWVVQVHDGVEDPALRQPAAAIGPTPNLLTEDEPLALDVCLAADPDASVAIAWASQAEAPIWHEGEPIASEGESAITLPFSSPPEAWGQTLLLRARVEGAGGEYSSYPLATIVVIKPGGPETGDEGTSATGADESEGEAGESDSSESDAGSGESGPGATDEGAPASCACTSASGSGSAGSLAALVLLALRVRRRR